ncbi:MAG: RebB family R body protein [Pseudomonadota bacterium]
MAASPTLSLAQAPAMAMGMTYLAMADSISLAMQNAVSNQQRGQVTAAAAVTQSLVLIITLGAKSK